MKISQRIFKIKPNVQVRVLIFFFLFSLPLFSISVYAGKIIFITKKLEKFLPEDKIMYPWVEKYNKSIEFLTKKENELSRFSLSISAGYIGHIVRDESLYKLDIGAEIKKILFPKHEFRFNVETSSQFSSNSESSKWKENVTTVLVNYDYHIKQWFEIYGFIEQFSDSYLSIQKRYEIGVGINFEFKFFVTKKGDEALRDFKNNDIPSSEFEGYINNPNDKSFSESEKDDFRNALKSLNDEYKYIKKCIKKNYNILSLGMAFTLLSELENAEIRTYLDNIIIENGEEKIIKTTKKEGIPLDGEDRFRIVVRPSIFIRPLDDLYFYGFIYLKYPLFRPRYSVNGEFDYRYDTLLRAKLNVKKTPSWAKKVYLVIDYRRHFDNLPPRFSEEDINEYRRKRQIPRKTIAEKTHNEFIFKLEIAF